MKKKSAEVKRIERIIEDHDRRRTQARTAGQQARIKLHAAQSRLWKKELARVMGQADKTAASASESAAA
jgi:hypothetical protein